MLILDSNVLQGIGEASSPALAQHSGKQGLRECHSA